jgi:hypothetical protein
MLHSQLVLKIFVLALQASDVFPDFTDRLFIPLAFAVTIPDQDPSTENFQQQNKRKWKRTYLLQFASDDVVLSVGDSIPLWLMSGNGLLRVIFLSDILATRRRDV